MNAGEQGSALSTQLVERGKVGINAAGQFITYLLVLMTMLFSVSAHALPVFARQTGQNCQACHAGGQFPELTPYGRLFKLTGYTIGKRTLPLAVMGVFGATNIQGGVNGGAVPPGPGQTATDGTLTFYTGSLFVAGKITDNTGLFGQFTFNSYGGDTGASGHMQSDNTDFRYANRIVNGDQDLIYGFSLNNNPGVQDVWNSMPAWGYGVVPIAALPVGANAPIIDGGLAQQAVGAGGYLYWNKTVYAELSGYRTGDGVFSFLTQGNGMQTSIAGTNPYLRLALTHEWGAQNVMVGYSYFDVQQYESGSSGLTDHYRDNTVDFQYQYLLDPHTFTADITHVNETVGYGSSGSVADTVNELRAKASYTYEAKYGAALGYFDISNTANNVPLANGIGFAQGGSEAWTPEVFWLPVQNVRMGVQYTMFDKVNGLTSNVDGNGTKASDFNTVVFYVWAAY